MLRYAARLSTHENTHPTLQAINKGKTPFLKTLIRNTSCAKTILSLNTKLPVDIFQVEKFQLSEKAPWLNTTCTVNLELMEMGKKENQEEHLKTEVLLLLERKYKNYTKIYTDG